MLSGNLHSLGLESYGLGSERLCPDCEGQDGRTDAAYSPCCHWSSELWWGTVAVSLSRPPGDFPMLEWGSSSGLHCRRCGGEGGLYTLKPTAVHSQRTLKTKLWRAATAELAGTPTHGFHFKLGRKKNTEGISWTGLGNPPLHFLSFT